MGQSTRERETEEIITKRASSIREHTRKHHRAEGPKWQQYKRRKRRKGELILKDKKQGALHTKKTPSKS